MTRNIELLLENHLLNKEGYSDFDYIALRDKRDGNVFWRVGGKYPLYNFELMHESNDEEEILNYCLAANEKNFSRSFPGLRFAGLS